MKSPRSSSLYIIAALFLSVASVRAVILFGTGDPSVNITAPTGSLADSGWQYQGKFGAFLGTVIASNYFITAKHIGGNVGDVFGFNGVNYTTTAVFPDPDSDLQIWRVAANFPIHATLFSSSPGTELNLNLVVFGRGTQRGSPVTVGNDLHPGGWLWGSPDGVQRWGTNVVGSIQIDPGYGRLLRAPFDSTAGANEAHLSVGDSGGAVFVFNTLTNQWELAGINLAVDGPFSRSSTGSNPFDAALFDTTGLFVQDTETMWVAAPNPSGFYSTEIAVHKGFIESVVMQLVSVVSRKTHGVAGTFDINLPETGPPGIECRNDSPANNYTLVFTFANNVTVQSAAVSSGTGIVAGLSAAGNVVTANLTGVTSAQEIVVTLINVTDGINNSDVQATMGVLVGDTTGDGTVNASDAAQTKSQVGQPINATNFREDVNANGAINSSDVTFVKSKSGTGLPAATAQFNQLTIK